MIQVDVPLAVGLGATLALAARRRLRTTESFLNTDLLCAVLFFSFCMVPSTLFFLVRWPAWDTLYVWEREDIPVWLPSLFVFAQVAGGLLGFIAAHHWIRRGRVQRAVALAVLGAGGAVGAMGVLWNRTLHAGTVASFQAGAPLNLFETDLYWHLLVFIPLGIFIPLALFYRILSKG